jgi:phage gpG-like protein
MSVKFEFKGEKELKKKLAELVKKIPIEAQKLILETAIIDIESYAKSNEIPVDTGRLRSSIHTKYIRSVNVANSSTHGNYSYSDNTGNSYDGSLSESVDINSVVVGTNVEYAQKINRLGGGGEGSGRTAGGSKKPKGYGKNFFDKAVNNGKTMLLKRLKDLSKRVDKL